MGRSFLSNCPHIQHFVFYKDVPPPSSRSMLHGVWDGGARPRCPGESGCALGGASKGLILSLPPSVLSVKQVRQPGAHFAEKVQLSGE